jgi:hypothetical protein
VDLVAVVVIVLSAVLVVQYSPFMIYAFQYPFDLFYSFNNVDYEL